MGGVFTPEGQARHEVEWNAMGDPRATSIVYQAPVRLHRSIGLDVTQQVVLPAEEIRKSFTAPILQPVLDFAEIWFAQFFPSITFHDPLAAATVFQPELCQYKQGIVHVDRKDHPGKTSFEEDGREPRHQVAISVDREGYFRHYFSILNGKG
jgi:inosine-uridine nucleoside N-ribohydrolase